MKLENLKLREEIKEEKEVWINFIFSFFILEGKLNEEDDEDDEVLKGNSWNAGEFLAISWKEGSWKDKLVMI